MAILCASLASRVRFGLNGKAPALDRSHTRLSLAVVLACMVASATLVHAQVPIILPNTISSIAGGGTLPASGAACATGSSYTATDAYGDGCPASLVGLGTSQWGIGVDKFGSIFWLDNISKVIHKIDARSGIMTKVAGGNSTLTCTGQTSPFGDNCVATLNFGNFNARGLTVDPWGNVILADYGNGLVHIICNAVSPLCSSTQIGLAEVAAGYVKNPTTAGGNVAGTTAGTAGDGTPGVSSVSTTGVNAPRGAAADVYGNVYVADTSNGRYRVVLGPASFKGVTNPLIAAIQSDPTYSTAVPGDIYPIEGGFTAVAKGNFCNGVSGAVSLDANGDGCPYFHTSGSGGTSNLFGVAIDPAGDAIFTDSALKLVRVLYVGGSQMAALITLENPGVTPVIGSVYAIAGGGAAGISTTPALATSQIWNSAPNSVALDPASNIYVGDIAVGEVMFIDINTGYAHVLFTKSGTPCAAKTDSFGDGCPVTQATFGGETYIVPIAVDNLGNLFLCDAANNRIRKVSAGSLMPTAVAAPATQTILVHEPAGVTSITAALTTVSPDLTVAAGVCTTNGDTTLDCPITVALNPSAPSIRSTALVVTPSGSSTTPTIFPMAGLSTGSALVTDGATSSSTGAILPTATLGSLTPLTVAVDGSNNVYSVNSSNLDFTVDLAGSATATLLSSTAPTGVSQIAVDTQGNIYAVGSGATAITKLTVTAAQTSSSVPPSYSAGTVSYTPTTTPAKPQGIVVDANGNIYVADGNNGAVYKITQSSSTQPLVTVATGFTNPTLLALDNQSNLYVYDAGTTKVLRVSYLGVQTTLASVAATGLATDAAGDVYVQTSSGVTEYPASGPASLAVYSGGTTPNGIALDGSGNLYISDAANSGILKVLRNAVSYNFGTGSSGSPTLTGTLTNAGNQAVTGSNTVTNTTNFAVIAGSSNGCTFSSSILGAQAIGNACTFSSTFVGNGSGAVSDVLTYLPASTVGSLTMSGTLQGSAIGTTTTISGQTPLNPVYSPSSTEVSFTVTVAPATGSTAPSGTIAVTVDSTITHPGLVASGTNGVAIVAISGLTAGSHSISAIYSTNGSFTGSNSGAPVSFSVAQDAPVASWTPGTTSLQYSAPVGTSVLNAAATFNSATVPGTFVYTANGVEINPASYLAVGTYTLNATFYPIDTVDYTTATVPGGSLAVTKATTTAAVGATQNLVASDGTGNFTSVQSAINALGANGGSIYIKPGTYTGFLTVVQPNVAFRGLGGDPTQVILTHEGGAFGGNSYPYTGEFTAANMSNGDQLQAGSTVSTGDAGSSTLYVARGINAAVSSSTLTPINFYAENLSLINGYNTDTATTTTTYEPTKNGTCTVNAGPPQTYSYLYNNGFQCASQALAIWIESDQGVMNNVYTASLQDTIYAGAISASGANPARQYWFRGKVTGDVDFMFGDAAAVFDHTTIYSAYHSTATGEVTIEAQSKFAQTGGASDYLSGFIMNSDVLTSQSSGMTTLYFGRPYVTSGSTSYSTWVMLNSSIDQVQPVGYVADLNGIALTTSTYGEYNSHPYTDPATGAADSNGVLYLGAGGNSGSGVVGTRELSSNNPGTLQVASNGFQTNYPTLANTTLSPAEAQQYYPLAFLGTTVPTSQYNTITNWSPTTALAANVNAFVPSGTSSSVPVGSSVTILIRPQTPGLGAVTNGIYTIPTGTYTLTDSFNGGSSYTLASGTLDASGEAYFTSASLTAGTHNLTWTYSGDSNFSGSTTASAYVLTVTGGASVSTTTSIGAVANPIAYGQSASITATVTPASGTTPPTGTVNLTIDGISTSSASLSSGTATFVIPGLSAGTHLLSATYTGATAFGPSSTVAAGNLSLNVTRAVLTVTGSCSNRVYGQVNVCIANVVGYQYTDGAAAVFSTTPTGTTTASRNSPAGPYIAPPLSSSLTLTPFGTTNYTVNQANTSFTVTGGAAQSIIFAPLPNFASGASYQLTARATSGLPVSYSITSGSASVVGGTLTVTGTGPVTVQASQTTDPSGDYAAATPVSRSFTAQ